MAEIRKTFEDIAKSIAQDPKVRKAMKRGDLHIASDRISSCHLSKLTLADLLRQCIRDSDEEEVERILEDVTS